MPISVYCLTHSASLTSRFKANTKTAELRLIDFGCGIKEDSKGTIHATFAGTPFYISPEVFQRKYTCKTDIWSAGVVLYVLVAGMPAEDLDYTFNLLHSANKDLKTLPGMPKDMPDSYYDMLDKMLAYDWKGRKNAAEMLDDEFALFHQALLGKGPKRRQMSRTASVMLSGTGEKATAAIGFLNFQRSGEPLYCYIFLHLHLRIILTVVPIIGTMLGREKMKYQRVMLLSQIGGGIVVRLPWHQLPKT
jgi:serine/threonine protein kinase